MFFFEEKKIEIVFEVDPSRERNFKLALETLGKTKEEAFDAFLGMLIAQALGEEKKERLSSEPSIETKRLSPSVIRSRILRWADRVHSYPHIMLKSYLLAERGEYGDEGVVLPKLMGHFNNIAGLPSTDNNKFQSIFRQMCSDSATAYGNVFLYDRRQRRVLLNESYKELVYSLKDKFITPEDL